VLLTGEPALVSLAAMLLEVVLEHNGTALASLYQTGLFFFALAYCGSNLVEIGRLFKVPFLLAVSLFILDSWVIGPLVTLPIMMEEVLEHSVCS
jgi:hypothetical protein